MTAYCVLEASAAVAWCFLDEATPASADLLDKLGHDEAWVPAVWHFEVPNVLLAAERRGRISGLLIVDFLSILNQLAIRTDPDLEPRLSGPVLQLARDHRLTLYDAAYLDVALRRSLPLATRDKALRAAAITAGVSLIDA